MGCVNAEIIAFSLQAEFNESLFRRCLSKHVCSYLAYTYVPVGKCMYHVPTAFGKAIFLFPSGTQPTRLVCVPGLLEIDMTSRSRCWICVHGGRGSNNCFWVGYDVVQICSGSAAEAFARFLLDFGWKASAYIHTYNWGTYPPQFSNLSLEIRTLLTFSVLLTRLVSERFRFNDFGIWTHVKTVLETMAVKCRTFDSALRRSRISRELWRSAYEISSFIVFYYWNVISSPPDLAIREWFRGKSRLRATVNTFECRKSGVSHLHALQSPWTLDST